MNLELIDIRDALYSGTDFQDIKKRHKANLRKSSQLQNQLWANKLESIDNMLENVTNIRKLEKTFYHLNDTVIKDWSKRHKSSVFLKGRIKNWIGTNEKIFLFIQKGEPLCNMNDSLGFRVIIINKKLDTIESIKSAYDLQNTMMKFLIEKEHCIFLEAEPRIDTDFNPSKHPNIIVPDKNLLHHDFIPFVKDYVKYPKWNGYQSLHCVCKNPDGLVFELQLRTYAMDLHAEYGTAEHTLHKNNRYKDVDFKIDYDNIDIPGFTVLRDEDGNFKSINDIVGLRKSINPFNYL